MTGAAADPFARAGSGFPSQRGRAEPFRIDKGKELRLRYAVDAHTGDAAAGKVADAYAAFRKWPVHRPRAAARWSAFDVKSP